VSTRGPNPRTVIDSQTELPLFKNTGTRFFQASLIFFLANTKREVLIVVLQNLPRFSSAEVFVCFRRKKMSKDTRKSCCVVTNYKI
jgi:hypothetical protein